ncbi:NAD-dependent epimerase/dehydratase family protein, partial [Streptomyces sp. NPDC059744]|uniref:NAD-dependent epimerase/dehydratase family protein n=1 Tax=Streptomyces sp. NPDC059744 TaxID=3346929 RepID=UPI00365A5069
RRDIDHERDVAAPNAVALEAVRERPAGSFTAYNTGSGEPHTIGEMATELACAHGGPAPEITGGYRLGDVRHVTADSRRLREELGWRPEVGFAEGMKEFAGAELRTGSAGGRGRPAHA